MLSNDIILEQRPCSNSSSFHNPQLKLIVPALYIQRHSYYYTKPKLILFLFLSTTQNDNKYLPQNIHIFSTC